MLSELPVPLACDPGDAVLLVSHLQQDLPAVAGGQMSRAIYIPAVFFPKYFTKASAIPSKYATRACITAHVLNRVWSGNYPKPWGWKTREDMQDSPQRS